MNVNTAMTPVSKDAPVMTAWIAYKQSADYSNTRKWATDDRHVDGSLWAAFEAGFNSANMLSGQRREQE